MVIAVVLVLLVALLALGVPVGFTLALTGSVGLYLTNGLDVLLNQLATTPYRSVANGTMAAIPLFILLAEFINQGGIATKLFNVANRFLGRLPGGVAIAGVYFCALFGAISGSSTAASATLGKVALPEFKRLGYGISAATGIVASAGTLATMIPPSTSLIVYGIMTENSIGKLLLAGFLPGLMTACCYSAGIYGWAKLRPNVLPRGEKFSFKEKIESLKDVWSFLVIAITVIVSLYTGFATPTETAALGAGAALAICLLTRTIKGRQIYVATVNTIKTFTMIMTLVIGAMIFGYFLALNRIPQMLIEIISNSGIPRTGILVLVLLFYLALGFFMDQMAILIITLPLSYPLMMSLGYDPIWYGVIMVRMVEIGLVTPPLGLNVYVTSAATGVPVDVVFRGTGQMLLFDMVALLLLLFIPEIATWLPSVAH